MPLLDLVAVTEDDRAADNDGFTDRVSVGDLVKDVDTVLVPVTDRKDRVAVRIAERDLVADAAVDGDLTGVLVAMLSTQTWRTTDEAVVVVKWLTK